MNLKVFIATHKKYWMPKDSVYVPLHVGREGKEDLGYMGDNTGDNISLKNSNYCELTGLYWIWKNIKCEYVGLCHYRRYFSREGYFIHRKEQKLAILDYEELCCCLKCCDVILPKKNFIGKFTVREEYEYGHKSRDLSEVEKIIKERYPEYSDDYDKVMLQHEEYFCNMFVMRKQLADEYCSWLFTILFELEKRIDISDYDSRQARVYGFLSERLFNVWLHHRNLKIRECCVVFLDDEEPSLLRITIRALDYYFPRMMDFLRMVRSNIRGRME